MKYSALAQISTPGHSASIFVSLSSGVLPTFPIKSCAVPRRKSHTGHSNLIGVWTFPILQLVIHLRRLLIRPGAIGDFIVSLPALESLRAGYTEVWCAGHNVPLARFADRAQSIIAAGLDRLGLLPADDVVERLRGFDSVISWYGTNRTEFSDLVRELGLPFQFLPALPGAHTHAVDFYTGPGASAGWRCAIPVP